MLTEMRDAAGSNGEFYTPRPVIRLIVNLINPDLKKSPKIFLNYFSIRNTIHQKKHMFL